MSDYISSGFRRVSSLTHLPRLLAPTAIISGLSRAQPPASGGDASPAKTPTADSAAGPVAGQPVEDAVLESVLSPNTALAGKMQQTDLKLYGADRPPNSMLVLFVALLVGGGPTLLLQGEPEAASSAGAGTPALWRAGKARRIGGARVRWRSTRRRSTLAPAPDAADAGEEEVEDAEDAESVLNPLDCSAPALARDPSVQKWLGQLRHLEAKPLHVKTVPHLDTIVEEVGGGGDGDDKVGDGEDDDDEDDEDDDAEDNNNNEDKGDGRAAVDGRAEALVAAAQHPNAEFKAVSEGCTGGVYRVTDAEGAPVGIWKPAAEEEQHRSGEDLGPLRAGLTEGDGAIREAAAYVLDSSSGGGAGVPPTALTSVGGKQGSIQSFVPHQCSADDMGTGKFGVDNVHKVGLLDLRLFNLDRHGGNLLVDGQDKLVPIDHGLCLPPLDCLAEAEFAWLWWRQAKQPFSAATKEWVAGLDAEADAERLRALGLPEASVATSRVCTTVLQRCVAAGLTLFEIGSLFVRKGLGAEPSALEKVVAEATEGGAVAPNSEASSDLIPRVTVAIDAVLAETPRA